MLYTTVYNIAFIPSGTTAGGRRPLPEEVDYFFRHDVHAACANVFVSPEVLPR